jgi:hypothetical protein
VVGFWCAYNNSKPFFYKVRLNKTKTKSQTTFATFVPVFSGQVSDRTLTMLAGAQFFTTPHCLKLATLSTRSHAKDQVSQSEQQLDNAPTPAAPRSVSATPSRIHVQILLASPSRSSLFPEIWLELVWPFGYFL